MSQFIFEIDYSHENAAWIICSLSIDGTVNIIHASGVFPPFVNLLYFVRAVAWQRLPVRFEIDEEGSEVIFMALPVAGDSPLMHLSIRHSEGDEDNEVWFDAIVEREAVVNTFLPPVLDFAYNFRKAEVAWSTPIKTVEKIAAEIGTGIPPRWDIHSPQKIEFNVWSDYQIIFVEGQVFLTARMHDLEIIHLLLYDTNPFWKEWAFFLHSVIEGQFPVQCMHNRFYKIFEKDTTPTWFGHTRVLAEAVEDSSNFRLKIFRQFIDEDEIMMLDEVVGIRQFVNNFQAGFDTFLRNNYKIFPDGEGRSYDLRTLNLV